MLLQELAHHTHNINSVVFNPDGFSMFTADGDGNIAVWEPDAGETDAQVATIEG